MTYLRCPTPAIKAIRQVVVVVRVQRRDAHDARELHEERDLEEGAEAQRQDDRRDVGGAGGVAKPGEK